MRIALELYGSLVLTILGFILPILTLLLSFFPEGVKELIGKYENEKKQSEDNIIEEIKKKDSDEDLDLEALESTLKSLRKKKFEAEIRLAYLDPRKIIRNIFIPFFFSFIGIIIALQNFSFAWIALTASIILFLIGIYILWRSLLIFVEVTEITNQNKKEASEKVIELLSKLVESSGIDNLFLKENEFKAKFYKEPLVAKRVVEFSLNKKYKIPVSLENSSNIMAKNVELGFIFPKNFLIEKTSNLNILTREKDQIIRFNQGIVQAHENFLKGDIEITSLKVGEYTISVFIKGENVKYHKFDFKIKVIE